MKAPAGCLIPERAKQKSMTCCWSVVYENLKNWKNLSELKNAY